MAPQLIFGTASFGMTNTAHQDADDVTSVLRLLESTKGNSVRIARLDTAARYPPNNPGQSETLLGLASDVSHRFVIDTKVATQLPDGSGDLTVEAVDRSVEQSLKRLKLDSVNVLYAHRADPTTPVVEQVRAFNKQIDAGRAKEYGLSNHSVQQVEAILLACDESGLRKPSVYQGDYNILTRGMETSLLPLLRKHGMCYTGFRPVAAGLLSGKLVSGNTAETRFGGDGPIATGLKKVFGSEVLHDTVRNLHASLAEHGLSGIEVGLRWLYFHSPLRDQDGIILGASRDQYLEQNLQVLDKGPLSKEVLQLVEQAWLDLKETRGSII